MLNCFSKLTSKLISTSSNIIINQQIRTTFILKRRAPTWLHKKGGQPKKLRSRHYVYDLIENTTCRKQPQIDLILTQFVDGLGNPGDKVTVKRNHAYNKFLLPGLAVYATPENIEKYKDLNKDKDVVHFSSKNAPIIMKSMGRMTLSVVMNKEMPWTLEPWHIKASFRKCGYVVPEEAITLPEKKITGPNMDNENKEFYVIITINNTEKFYVRCRIHHWSTNVVDRLTFKENFWKETSESIYPEFEDILNKIPAKPN